MRDIFADAKGNGTPIDPQKGFDILGFHFYLDADPDSPRLWEKLSEQGSYCVAEFTVNYDPFKVYLAALGRVRQLLIMKQSARKFAHAGYKIDWEGGPGT